jgi:hypothetical protein
VTHRGQTAFAIALAGLALAAPTAARDAADPEGDAKAAAPRLVVGEPRGLSVAGPGRPVRVPVGAEGATVRRIVVTLRASGQVLGRSGRFKLGAGERKVARIPVERELVADVEHTARAVGHVRGSVVRGEGAAARAH